MQTALKIKVVFVFYRRQTFLFILGLTFVLESVQDLMIKLDMKPYMYLA